VGCVNELTPKLTTAPKGVHCLCTENPKGSSVFRHMGSGFNQCP
jgi:hypothetical protein